LASSPSSISCWTTGGLSGSRADALTASELVEVMVNLTQGRKKRPASIGRLVDSLNIAPTSRKSCRRSRMLTRRPFCHTHLGLATFRIEPQPFPRLSWKSQFEQDGKRLWRLGGLGERKRSIYGGWGLSQRLEYHLLAGKCGWVEVRRQKISQLGLAGPSPNRMLKKLSHVIWGRLAPLRIHLSAASGLLLNPAKGLAFD
jgi:hypothetical protein